MGTGRYIIQRIDQPGPLRRSRVTRRELPIENLNCRTLMEFLDATKVVAITVQVPALPIENTGASGARPISPARFPNKRGAQDLGK